MPTRFFRAAQASTARRQSLSALTLALSLLSMGSCGKIEEVSEPTPQSRSAAARGGNQGGPAQSQSREQGGDELFNLAVNASLDGDVERSVKLYRKALEKDAKLTAARFGLGKTLVPTASASALGSGTKDPKILAEAISHLRQACDEEPKSAEYAYWLGRTLDVAGEEAEAVKSLSLATELDPEHGPAFKRLGLVNNELGNREAALAAWLRAGELMPTDGGIFFNLGNYYNEDDLERSIDYYRRCTEVEPTSPKGYQGLSKALAQLGDKEGAAKAKALFDVYKGHAKKLKRLVHEASLAPDNIDKQFQAAEMYFALKQYDSSLGMFRRVLLLNPKDAFAHFYIGEIFTAMGDVEAALPHYEECVYNEPGVPDSLLALLRSCVDLKDEVRAGEVCETLEPLVETAENHATFAELLAKLGKQEQADMHAAKGQAAGK
jgi:tetratricopeptide (TPR) repeat protein